MDDGGVGDVRWPTPIEVLKWSGVIFVVCLQVLVVVAIILSMAGVFA